MGFALPFQVDHIRALKHGGTTMFSNLAYCCPECNRFKGTDPGSYGDDGSTLIPFFNPRKHIWAAHFSLDGGYIKGITQEGLVTVRIFRFNLEERMLYRMALLELQL